MDLNDSVATSCSTQNLNEQLLTLKKILGGALALMTSILMLAVKLGQVNNSTIANLKSIEK